MASLAAALRRAGGAPDDAVGRMLAAAPHRGTEACTTVVGNVAIGVAAQRDADDGALYQGDGYGVALVGMVDNADALARELGVDGADAAGVIAAAWRRWGTMTPARLRGVFAAVVTDGVATWAFRDQLGSRALFHRHDASGGYVASEAKQVVAGARIAREPDLDVLTAVFYDEYDDDTPTALAGVDRLRKAAVLTADGDGRVSVEPYWRPADLLETARLSDDELTERFDVLLAQAVSRTFSGADVLGLSGGIDSTAIACCGAPIHRERFGTPLVALSQVYPRFPSVDESAPIALVAERSGVELHTYETDESPGLDDLDDWTALIDGPVPTWTGPNVLDFYRRVRALGGRTALGGEIAEYVFDLFGHVDAHLVASRKWGAVARRARERRRAGTSRRRIVRSLLTPFTPRPVAKALTARGRGFARKPLPAWLEPRPSMRAPSYLDLRAGERWSNLQLRAFQGPGLGYEADQVIQDVAGVVARRPFADVDLWELFLSLPAEQKFRHVQSKALVRSLLRGRVPDEILDRRDKTVFNEAIMASIDYPGLRKWLTDPGHRMPGVDYAALADVLDREALDIAGYVWARDLALVHAFLATW